jgi:Activator of Hsp90 ATPase homolog 1-like protein
MTAKPTDAVTATVEVALDPASAFEIFTEEIGRWWRPGPINWNDSGRAIGIRIEPGVGGRWIEVYDEATGEGFECGRITVWEPGARFVFLYRDAGRAIDDTEVEVRFEAVDGGTRVTLEHRGWDKVSPDIAGRKRETKRWGWASILGWYKEWAFWGSPRRIQGRVTAGNTAMASR